MSRRTFLSSAAAATVAASTTWDTASGTPLESADTTDAATHLSASNLRNQVKALLDQHPDGAAPIIEAGDPILRSTAQRYDGQIEKADLLALTELMRRTMHAAPGVGLAAPQIGLPLQMAVIEDPATVSDEVAAARQRYPQEFLVIINPVYAPLSTRTTSFYEGCLSVTGYQAVVRRHTDVALHFTDLAGTDQVKQFSGWPARIVQHETDHLGGTLYLDRAEHRSLTTQQTYLDKWADPVPTKAAEAFHFSLD